MPSYSRIAVSLFCASWVLAGSSSCSTEESSVVAPPVPQFTGNDRSVSFGSNETYRLGDGDATDTSCATDLGGLSTAGTAFQFTIEVMNDNTDLDIRFEDICGVDFSNNLVSLSRDNTIIALDALPPLTEVREYQFDDVPAGIYMIRVEAGAKFQGPDVDLDDFIVGKLLINANQDVRKIGVPAALSEAKVQSVYESDEMINYLLGDAFGNDSICQAGSGVDTEVEGSVLEWQIQTTDLTTSLIFDIEEVCGLDFDLNYIELLNQSGQRVFKQFFDPSQDFLLSPQQVVIPGNYTLRIESNTALAGSDLDDFRIRILKIFHSASSGTLNITPPVE